MYFNAQADGKSNRLLAENYVNRDDVLDVSKELHDEAAYQAARPLLVDNWRTILRDQCTRTNVRLVRPADVEFFERWSLG